MNCIVFDKTGTLTVGKPVVVTTKLLKDMSLKDFYKFAAAAEASLLLLTLTIASELSLLNLFVVLVSILGE